MDDGEDLNFILDGAIGNDEWGIGDAEFADRGDTARVAGGRIATHYFGGLEGACHKSRQGWLAQSAVLSFNRHCED